MKVYVLHFTHECEGYGQGEVRGVFATLEEAKESAQYRETIVEFEVGSRESCGRYRIIVPIPDNKIIHWSDESCGECRGNGALRKLKHGVSIFEICPVCEGTGKARP